MKNMMKHMMLVIVGIAMPGILYAQTEMSGNVTPGQRAEYQTAWMRTELSLDSMVVSDVYDINLKYAKKMEKLRGNNTSRRAKFREFRSLSDKKDRELKSIFNENQYHLYQKKKKEMRDKMKQHMQEKR